MEQTLNPTARDFILDIIVFYGVRVIRGGVSMAW